MPQRNPISWPTSGAATRVPNRFAIASILILVLVVIDPMGIGLIMPVVQDLIREFRGAGPGEAALWGGMLAAAFAGMQFLFRLFLGNLSDCHGRRPVLLCTLVVMSIDYLIMAVTGLIRNLLLGPSWEESPWRPMPPHLPVWRMSRSRIVHRFERYFSPVHSGTCWSCFSRIL